MITSRSNYIEVITGPMFAGKTTEMIRKYDIFKACNKSVQFFKKKEDNRFEKINTVTHSRHSIEKVYLVDNISNIEDKIKDSTDVIMIDEAQFFTSDLIDKVNYWVNDKTVILTLLPSDANGNPFKFADMKRNVGDLLAIADYITQVHSKCMYQFSDGSFCYADATKSFRLSGSNDLVEIGGADKYKVYCRKHFTKMLKKQKEEQR